ncbi:hypothetical protein [Ramlibacter albus]|uniref:Uncharacterized protein n=1 Tax=Ramlibacter albus TaxID=2079448 RepID=A0A923M6D0_9BURK|nr:hypothetical protein [Ramlibacter albus]MBC5765057.1 hypothetical protein [Ramlibacter albus]
MQEPHAWPQYLEVNRLWTTAEIVACAAALLVGLPLVAVLVLSAEGGKPPKPPQAKLEPLVLPTVVVSAQREPGDAADTAVMGGPADAPRPPPRGVDP